MSKEFRMYLKSKGMKRQVTIHNTLEHNGIIKRLNRLLLEQVQAMINASMLPKTLWGETIMHAM